MTIAALEQALTFISRTDLTATARQQPLPMGVTELLKICSGDNESLLAAQESSRHSQEDVRHAAEFYVQQILFAPDSDHYRILGVDPDDAESKIKLHYRLLVRWLHPDKNSSDWEVVFSERINRAWHALRTPERRRQYDEQLSNEKAQAKSAAPSREMRPAQWRESRNDPRFMSSRTIKRLPIAVFSLLGVGALLALLWFSQTQPNLEAPTTVSRTPEKILLPVEPSKTASPAASMPVDQLPENIDTASFIEQKTEVADPEKQPVAPALAVVSPPVGPLPKIAVTSEAKTTEKPGLPALAAQEKPKIKNPPKPQMQVAENIPATLVAENKPVAKRSRKIKQEPVVNVAASSQSSDSAPAVASPVVVASASSIEKDLASDASVKQFLQKFSRVYSEGDYFALHNMFTRDMSILGAPAQRTVLRSYRQLFENSQSREINLDHVTWLTNDESIVVIASYQAQVIPRGKSESQSSRGDIRLDLRVENGQLRIIRLQSDIKNG